MLLHPWGYWLSWTFFKSVIFDEHNFLIISHRKNRYALAKCKILHFLSKENVLTGAKSKPLIERVHAYCSQSFFRCHRRSAQSATTMLTAIFLCMTIAIHMSSVERNRLSLLLISIHYIDAIMSAVASQITSFTIVYSTVYSGADHWPLCGEFTGHRSPRIISSNGVSFYSILSMLICQMSSNFNHISTTVIDTFSGIGPFRQTDRQTDKQTDIDTDTDTDTDRQTDR